MDQSSFSLHLIDGNEIDYTAFTLAYHDSIYSICRRYSRDEHDASDLTQEFLVSKIFENDLINKYKLRVDQSQPRMPFRKYLFRSVTYFCIEKGRKRNKTGEVAQDPINLEFLIEEAEGIDRADLEYAVNILHRTFSRVRNYYEEKGRLNYWFVFKENTLDPYLRRENQEMAESAVVEDTSAADHLSRKVASRRVFEIRNRYLPESSNNQDVFDICTTVRKKVVSTFDLILESDAFEKNNSHEKDEIFRDWLGIFSRFDESLFSALSAALITSSRSESISSQSATQSMQLVLELPTRLDELTSEELAYLLGYRINMPLIEWIDSKTLVEMIPKKSPFISRNKSTKVRMLSIEVLLDPSPEEFNALTGLPVVELLKLIKNHSRELARNKDLPIPATIYGLFYTLASVLAFDRYKQRIYSITDHELRKNTSWYIQREWIDERVKRYFHQFQLKS